MNIKIRDPFWRSPLINLESHLAIPFIQTKYEVPSGDLQIAKYKIPSGDLPQLGIPSGDSFCSNMKYEVPSSDLQIAKYEIPSGDLLYSTWNPIWRFLLFKAKIRGPFWRPPLMNIEIRDPFWRSQTTWNPIWRFLITKADIDVVLPDDGVQNFSFSLFLVLLVVP